MKTKEKKLTGYLVYAWVPVNVKVKASSVEAAQELALNALTAHRLRELDTDDSRPIYLDDGIPCKLDDQPPAALDADGTREYARTEASK